MKKLEVVIRTILLFIKWKMADIIERIEKKHTQSFVAETLALINERFGFDCRYYSCPQFDEPGHYHHFEILGINV